MYILEREIIVDAEMNEVWEFLATPANLNELTPPNLNFRILSEVPPRMHNGLMILYEIRTPLFGTRRWLTEIKHIRDGTFFVDEQRRGPYRFWYHEHGIEACQGNKTRMIDRVFYLLPFSVIGVLVHRLLIRKMLEDIFDYRARQLHKRFSRESRQQ